VVEQRDWRSSIRTPMILSGSAAPLYATASNASAD
jgi:hypothetical protein